jgi:hypothetical protein
MDNNFQTSFIPKKPMTVPDSNTGSGINIFLLISIFIFLVAVVASVGVYFWQSSLKVNLTAKVAELTKLQQEEPTTLDNLIAFDQRLNITDKLLQSHVAVSPVFDYLQENTAQDIRFKSLNFSYTDANNVTVKMSGVAKNFNAIAGQSDAFNPERSRVSGILNPVFSDFAPTPTGEVNFSLTADLDPELTNYSAQKDKAVETAPTVDQAPVPFGGQTN